MITDGVKCHVVFSEARKYEKSGESSRDMYNSPDPKKMSDVSLMRCLCSAGPAKCKTCKLCAYGREAELRGYKSKSYDRDKARRMKAYTERIAAGMCVVCGVVPADKDYTTCEMCREKKREFARRSREKRKQEEREKQQNGNDGC